MRNGTFSQIEAKMTTALTKSVFLSVLAVNGQIKQTV